MSQKKRWGRLLAGAVAVGLLGVGALTQSTEVSVATPGNAEVFAWKGFNWNARPGVLAGKNSRAMTRLANVGVYTTGDLWIKTARHCLAGSATLTESTPEHPAICEAGTRPVYSTGRIQTDIPASVLPSGHDFTFTFDAKVPKGEKGTRTALWTRNRSAAGCDSLYSEIDVMESYGVRDVGKDGTWPYDQTAWSGCAGGQATKIGESIRDKVKPGYRHTYSATRTANQIAFFRDGISTGSRTCGSASCPASLGQPWEAIIQGEVFKEGASGSFDEIDTKPFTTITTIVYGFSVQARAPQVPAFTVAAGSNIVNGHTEPYRRLNLAIANQPLMSWSCLLDNAAYSCPNPFAIDIGPLANSGHTFSIKATNAAGTGTYNTSWYGGQSKPVITVAAGSNIVNGHTEPFRRLNLSIGNQPLTTWSCVLDNAPYTCSNPFAIDIGPLTNNGHTFSMTATNFAGSTTYNTSWYGGQSVPVVTQSANTVNGSRLSYYHANYAIQNQPLVNWWCTLDGAPYSCPNPFSVDIGPVSYSGHSFRIYFQNYAGTTWSGSDWFGGA